MAQEQGLFKLPAFPTEFTASDAERLDQLSEQRKMLQNLYLQHYTPEKWEGKPATERYLRSFASTVGLGGASHALRDIIPGEAFQWGLTPEQARTYRLEIEGEYEELKRRQKVSIQSENIMQDIRLLALSGMTISTIADLYRRFPELGDWKESEVAFIASFAQSLVGKTPEQIVQMTAEMPEITPEMIAAAYGEKPSAMPPEYILSAVGFSQDVIEIKNALASAFPPNPEAVSEDEKEQTAKALLSDEEQQLLALGIMPGDTSLRNLLQTGVPLEDLIQQKHEAISAGKEIILMDIDTGMRITGTITDENLVWVDGELLGKLDEETNVLFPVGLDGTIFYSVYEEENWFKDKVLDPVTVWSARATHAMWGFLTAQFPQTVNVLLKPLNNLLFPAGEETPGGYEVDKQKFAARAMAIQEHFDTWYAENPQLRPKPQYEENPWKNREVFGDPGYWVYQISSSVMYTVMVLEALAIGTMASGGNIGVGAALATAAAGIPEANSMANELYASGVDYETAVAWGNVYGLIAGGVETFSDVILLGAVSKAFKNVNSPFWKFFKVHFKNRLVHALAIGLTIEMTEGVEELITSASHDAILDMFGDVTWLEYVENMQHAFTVALIAATPFALWGGGADFHNFTGSLSADIRRKIDEAELRFSKAGATQEEARVLAVQEVILHDKDAAESISVTLNTLREEHNTFMALSPDERAAVIREDPVLARNELLIAKAELNLLNEEYEGTKLRLGGVKGSLEAEPGVLGIGGAPKGFESLAVELEAKLETLARQRNALVVRVGEIREALSAIPAEEVAPSEAAPEAPVVTRGKITGIDKVLKVIDKAFASASTETVIGINKILNAVKSISTAGQSLESFKEAWLSEAGKPEFAELDVIPSDKVFKKIFNALEVEKITQLTPEMKVENATSELARLKTELGAVNDKVRNIKDSLGVHEKRVRDLIASKGNAFEVGSEKEIIDSLQMELNTEVTHQESLVNRVNKAVAELNEAEAEVAGAPAVDGIPMPSDVQKQFLAEAQAELDKAPENVVPGSLQVFSRPWGDMFVVTNRKGEILVMGTLALREGKQTIEALVANSEKGMAAARAVPKVLAYIEENNIAFPPKTEMSPDALKVFKHYQETKEESAPLATKGAKYSGVGITEDVAARIASEDVARAFGSKFVPVNQPQTIDGVPTIDSWDEERLATTEALTANKKAAKAIVYPIIRDAGILWDATDNDTRLAWTEKTNMRKKVREATAAKKWDDIPPTIQEKLTLASIPDNSAHAKKLNLLWDKRYIFQWLQEKFGQPFYPMFKRIERIVGIAERIRNEILDSVDKNPEFRAILRDKEAQMRMEQELSSRNPDLKVEAPLDITPAESRLADVFEAIFKKYEPKIRYLRFLREYEEHGTLDGVYKAIIGNLKLSPAEEVLIRGQIQDCIDFYNLGDLNGLWNYVQDKAWGVVGSGYTPWMVVRPNLFPSRLPLSSTRGASRLMHRDSVEFPSGMRTFIQRFGTYVKQVETYFYLRPELKRLDSMLQEVSSKMDYRTAASVEANLRSFVREIQGLPSEGSHRTSILRRLYRQFMSAVFVHPYLSFRNLHQHLAFYPDRSELFRYLVDRPPSVLREKMNIFYDSLVSQMSAIRRDYMYSEEQGLPGLAWMARLAQRLSAYPLSDNIPRKWSCYASINKAFRAAQQFQKDGNINKWKKNSGVLHLTQTEQNYAIELLLREDPINWGVKGLRSLTGAEASSFFIGQEVANDTHFVYDRAFRAEIEQGETGRLIFNLLVFPRSYVQRITLQTQKLISKESSTAEKIDAFKNMAMMIIVGAMISEWLAAVTMRPRRSYNPFDIIRWDLGGLALGGAMELTHMISLASAAASPITDPEYRKAALAQLPGLATRNALIIIPFYKIFVDSLEAIVGKENVDLWALRQMRSWLDENYTAAELENLEMTLREKFTKALLGGKPADPDVFDKGQTDLMNLQAELGQVDAVGKFYVLRNFATDIKKATSKIPDDMLTTEYGWSELVLYYFDFMEEYESFQDITSVGDARGDYRKGHPEFNVWLCFWGFYSTSLSKPGTEEWYEFLNHIQTLFDFHNIDARMHGEWADWSLNLVPRA